SKAIYDFLSKHQPRLSLHGHIHESPQVSGRWHARLGNTICIQPGQLEPFTYVVIDLETMKFDRHTETP
ncbi:MAG: phosphoesterase, partial [Anaerolineae bacterium]